MQPLLRPMQDKPPLEPKFPEPRTGPINEKRAKSAAVAVRQATGSGRPRG